MRFLCSKNSKNTLFGKGDSTYDTVFQTVRGDTLILRVQLNNNGSSLPSLSLAGVKARHAWLDSGMRVVGYPPVQSESNWNQASLLLGKAVHAAVQEFQVHPPEILQIVDANLQSIQSKHAHSSSLTSSQSSASESKPSGRNTSNQDDAPPDYFSTLLNNTNSSSIPAVDMPSLPSNFPELQTMDRDELDELLNDELAFQAFCHKLRFCRELQTIGTSVIDENAEMAHLHLQDESVLQDLQGTCQTRQKELQQKVAAFQKLEKEQDKLCRPPDRRKMIRELQKAKKEAFEKSEDMAEEWLELEDARDGVDAFVKDFVEVRKLHHLRAAKLELLEMNPVAKR